MKKICLLICSVFVALGAFAQASLVSVSPVNGNKGQTLNITITGKNTHFGRGKDSIAFLRGAQITNLITVNSQMATDSTHIVANITIAATANNGLYGVRVINSADGAMLLQNSFTVGAALTSASPNSFMKGATSNITISGTGTSFTKGPVPSLTIRQGATNSFTINSRQVVNDTTLTASVTVGATLATGAYVVTVADSLDGSMILSGTKAVQVVGPVLVSATPNVLVKTTTTNVDIKGTLTNFSQGSVLTVTIKLGTTGTLVINSVTAQSDTIITANVTVPGNSPSGQYTVTVMDSLDGTMTLVNSVQVKGGSLLNISPNLCDRNQTIGITITGLNTQFVQDSTNITFLKGAQSAGFTVSSIFVNSATSVTASVTIPSTIVPGKFTVRVNTTRDGTMNMVDSFTVNGPFIGSVVPNTSYRNKTFTTTVVGKQTNFTAGTGTSISFIRQGAPTNNIVANSVNVVNDTLLTASITVKDTAATGNYQLLALNSTDSFMTFIFNVSTPTVATLTPATGMQGTTMNLIATARGTTFTHVIDTSFKFYAGTALTTNIVVNSITATNDTNVTINITIAPTATIRTYSLRYTGKYDGTLQWNNLFSVTKATATIVSILPDSAGLGQTVTGIIIKGKNTQFTKNTSGVSVQFLQTGVPTSNISVGQITVQNDSTLLINASISTQATALGRYDLLVADSLDGVMMLNQSFKVVGSAVGFDELSGNNNVIVYPNPAKEKLTIFSKQEPMERVELFDLKGKLVHSINTKLNRVEINLAELNLAKQIYLLKIQTKDSCKTHKLLVE